MNGNAIIFSYDTRVDSITFWSVLVGGAFLLATYIVIRRSKMSRLELVGFLLAEYISILLLLTVFFRETPIFPDGFHNSFWGDKSLLTLDIVRERALNMFLFFPIGLLLCNLLKKQKIVISVVLGFILSFFIEILQYYFNKGVADIDDVVFNEVGVMAGALLGLLANRLLKSI